MSLSTRCCYSLAREAVKGADRSLFGKKQVQHGYKISFSHSKSHRIWMPNIQRKAFESEILQKIFSIKVTTSEIRTIKKYGGLDGYILNMKEKNLNSEFALKLKEQMRRKLEDQQNSKLPALEAPSIIEIEKSTV